MRSGAARSTIACARRIATPVTLPAVVVDLLDVVTHGTEEDLVHTRLSAGDVLPVIAGMSPLHELRSWFCGCGTDGRMCADLSRRTIQTSERNNHPIAAMMARCYVGDGIGLGTG